MQVRRLLAVLAVGAASATSLAGCGGGSVGPSPHSRPPATVPTSTATPPASSPPAPTPPPTSTAVPTPTPTRRTTPPATTAPPAALLGREWTRIPTTRHVVALTFDAGANADGLPSILATLDRENVTGTFFLTGRWVDTYPSRARTVCGKFRVGDHSVTHPQFTTLTDAEIRAQVLDAAATMQRVCGADPRPLFRFPFGDRDTRTITAVNAVGYIPVGWTVDTLGWKGTSGGQSVSSVAERVIAALQPGEIVLMHVGSNPDDHTTLDADALPTLIGQLRARGYGFVSLDALLG